MEWAVGKPLWHFSTVEYTRIYTHIRIYAYTQIRIYAYTHILIYAYTHIRIYVYMYIFIYAKTYTRTCAYGSGV